MTRNISNKKLNMYIRRVVFVLAILLVSAIQNTPHLFPEIFGAHAFLLLPLIISISMFERDIASTMLGILAGSLWDVSSSWGDGFNAVYLMIMATVTGMIINYLLRNNLSTAFLISGISIVIYILLHWFFFVICRGVEGGGLLLFTFYFPSAIYTFLFTPVFYILIRSFMKKLKEKFPHKTQFTRL